MDVAAAYTRRTALGRLLSGRPSGTRSRTDGGRALGRENPEAQAPRVENCRTANSCSIILEKMPRSASYTVAYRRDGTCVDLCRVVFGSDGSYYVTAPYHPLDRAFAEIYTVNYAQATRAALSDAVELALLDDDERRLKISHHPDGFLQFSGEGVRSGRDEAGKPRGIGVMSWPLNNPTFGPSFSLMFSDPIECGRVAVPRSTHIVFDESDLLHIRRQMSGLRIAGYYFPTRWRESVSRTDDGAYWLHLLHPNGQALKRLRVVPAGVDAEHAGLIGLEALPHGLKGAGTDPIFVLSTSTGNLRRNDDGDLLGDQLMCFYAQPDLCDVSFESLNYTLPSPSPTAPPGTTSVDVEPET